MNVLTYFFWRGVQPSGVQKQLIFNIFIKVFHCFCCCCCCLGAMGIGRAMMSDIMQALPGIDEAMSYSEVMKSVTQHVFYYFYS